MKPTPSFTPADTRFLLALTTPIPVLVGYQIGDNFHAFYIFFILIPILDWLVGARGAPAGVEEQARLGRSAFFRAVLLAYVPIHLALILWGASTVGLLEGWQAVGFALSVGLITGAQGITIGHELGHKAAKLDRWAARVLLYTVSYGHFTIEHNRGHHVRVAMHEDPASARYGEGFWRFLPRTLVGNYLGAWKLELARLRPRGLHWWSRRNEMLWATLIPPFIMISFGMIWGASAAFFFLGQSAMAILLLEATNYIEHYGLERAHGERIAEKHSWDAYHWLSNCYLLHLQRHADHHLEPMRPYAALQPREASPKLPFGYPGMVPLVLAPPLWFAVINPRVPKPAGA